MSPRILTIAALLATALAVLASAPAPAEGPSAAPPAPRKQSEAQARQSSAGCMSCHTTTDSLSMHSSPGVILGCTDCHGGNAAAFVPPGAQPGSAEYRRTLDAAHVPPRNPAAWNYPSSVKPPQTYTLLNEESPGFIRF